MGLSTNSLLRPWEGRMFIDDGGDINQTRPMRRDMIKICYISFDVTSLLSCPDVTATCSLRSGGGDVLVTTMTVLSKDETGPSLLEIFRCRTKLSFVIDNAERE